MFVKSFIVAINSSLETMYEQLADAGLDYMVERFEDDNYLVITFETLSAREIQEAIHIMKWYV